MMKNLLKYLSPKKDKTSASLAKERLQIIIAHERGQSQRKDFLSDLRQELITVIARYLGIEANEVEKQVKFDIAHCDEQSVMELNITIPEESLPGDRK